MNTRSRVQWLKLDTGFFGIKLTQIWNILLRKGGSNDTFLS